MRSDHCQCHFTVERDVPVIFVSASECLTVVMSVIVYFAPKTAQLRVSNESIRHHQQLFFSLVYNQFKCDKPTKAHRIFYYVKSLWPEVIIISSLAAGLVPSLQFVPNWDQMHYIQDNEERMYLLTRQNNNNRSGCFSFSGVFHYSCPFID